jgi:hypothetical protein
VCVGRGGTVSQFGLLVVRINVSPDYQGPFLEYTLYLFFQYANCRTDAKECND